MASRTSTATLLLASLLVATLAQTGPPGSSYSCIAVSSTGNLLECSSSACQITSLTSFLTVSLSFSQPTSAVYSRCAASEDLMVVGHREEEIGANRITVFDATTGSELQTMSISTHYGSRFGRAIGVGQGVVVVGAPLAHSPNTDDVGAVYVYYPSSGANPLELFYTTYGDEYQNGRFGQAVAVSDCGQRFVVLETQYGAPARGVISGRVFLYEIPNGETDYTLADTYVVNSTCHDIDMQGDHIFVACDSGLRWLTYVSGGSIQEQVPISELSPIASNVNSVAVQGNYLIYNNGADSLLREFNPLGQGSWDFVSTISGNMVSVDGDWVVAASSSTAAYTNVTNVASSCQLLPSEGTTADDSADADADTGSTSGGGTDGGTAGTLSSLTVIAAGAGVLLISAFVCFSVMSGVSGASSAPPTKQVPLGYHNDPPPDYSDRLRPVDARHIADGSYNDNRPTPVEIDYLDEKASSPSAPSISFIEPEEEKYTWTPES